MAVTPVSLQIEGFAEREVLKVEYSFKKETDIEGQITGIPRGGKIEITVKPLNDGNPDLMAFMVDKNLRKNGKIVFKETKSGQEMKKIEFEGAYCVDYEENWADNEMPSEMVVLTCQNITFGNIKYENPWK